MTEIERGGCLVRWMVGKGQKSKGMVRGRIRKMERKRMNEKRKKENDKQTKIKGKRN